MSVKKWYVYLLCDPDTEVPFYVGKGKGKRMNAHEDALSLADANEAKKETIRRILAQGKKVLKKKVAEFDHEQDALIYEMAMIGLYANSLTNVAYSGAPFHRTGKAQRMRRFAAVPPMENMWTPKQMAAQFGVSLVFLSKLQSQQGLPSVEIGDNVYFNPEAVHDWVRSRTW